MKRFLSFFTALPQWAFLCLFLGSIFLYHAIIGLQGFDMCDEGWVLTAYQQIFEHPLSAEYQFLYYNGALVGGVWNILFGFLGTYGFRLLSGLCITIIAFVVYKMLYPTINRWCIFLGVFLVVVNQGFIMVFHHNYLTGLLACLAAFLIYKAVSKDKKWVMIFAGLFIGINIFTRIPNISMLSLSLILIPYYFYTKDLKKTLGILGFAALGLCLGIITQVGIMAAIGHLDIFINNLSSGTSAVSAGDSTHNISNIFKVYISNYRTVYEQMGLLVSYPIFLYFLPKFNKSLSLYKMARWIGGFVYAIAIWKMGDGTFILYALAYATFAIYLLRNYNCKNHVYLITLATIILFFLPFGSDYGIGNMGPSCIWVAMPLAIGLIYDWIVKRTSITTKIIKDSVIVFTSIFIAHGLYYTSLNCYFDHGSRLKKTYRVNHSLVTTFTNKEKCVVVDELLDHINEYVNEGDYLLSYQSLPMIHYLTHTYPYLNNSWPWSYDTHNLERHFISAEQNIEKLPIVLLHKSGIASWTHYCPEWNSLSASDQWNFNSKKIELMQKFLEQNHYEIVWENELFQILKSSIQQE